ncbi:MAG: hypothetical protein ACPGOY_00045 [Rhodospirillaceae bacterium]
MSDFGPTFFDEIAAAGLFGKVNVIDGALVYSPDTTEDDIAAAEAVLAAHDPTKTGITAAAVKAEAGRRLAETDWYVVRMTETGQATPADVLTHRAAIRTTSDQLEQLTPIPTDYAANSRWPVLTNEEA